MVLAVKVLGIHIPVQQLVVVAGNIEPIIVYQPTSCVVFKYLGCPQPNTSAYGWDGKFVFYSQLCHGTRYQKFGANAISICSQVWIGNYAQPHQALTLIVRLLINML